jgi:hypothetical protein
MAKKKKKKNPAVSFLGSMVAFFKDDRFRYALGIVFLLLSLFLNGEKYFQVRRSRWRILEGRWAPGYPIC